MLKAMKNKLIVKPDTLESTTPSGIVLNVDAGQRPDTGTVITVGDGIREVKKDDRVLFGKYSGNEIKLGDETYLILKEDEVFAVLQ